MALQLRALRNALLEAAATPGTAGKAAEEVAGYKRDFSTPRTEMERKSAKVAHEFISFRAEVARGVAAARSETMQGFADARADRDDLRSDITVLKWSQAVTVAGIVALLLKTFFH